MSRREGVIVLSVDQQLDGNSEILILKIIRSRPRHKGFQRHVTDQHTHYKGDAHGDAGFSRLGEYQHQYRPGNPEDAALPEQGHDGHDGIQKAALQVRLNPVQNRQVKADRQLVQ